MGRSAWISGLLVVGAALAVACTQNVEEDAARSGQASTRDAFDKNDVLDDESLMDVDAMTESDVQSFLDKTPWGTRSVLARYSEDGSTAAELMYAAAKKHGINPLVLLVRLQMEQGLVSKTSAPQSTIDIAFGCGCPHSPVCSDKYMGFANQAECAAGTLRRSVDKVRAGTTTVSGWTRGKPKSTQDGLMITPKNATTAALYTYTPWVGEAGGGKAGVGGASLHWKVWTRFAGAAGYGEWAAPSTPTKADAGSDPSQDPAPRTDAGAGGNDPSCTCTSPNFPVCDSAGNCVACTQDSHCQGGDVCDTRLNKCVECAPGKTSACSGADKGSQCMANATCGCTSDDDCATGRECDPFARTCKPKAATTPDAGPEPEPEADAGAPTKEPPSSEPPPGGEDDDSILSEGNETPANNPVPPASTPRGGESPYGEEGDLTEATADELAPKKKKAQGGGCNTTGSSGGDMGLVLTAAALAQIVRRRRRAA
ncbi:MAG: hypothetical protein KC657_22700 [Myxococcales bacterium]|nr:hypothetical protein [Myxococcales bacterium]